LAPDDSIIVGTGPFTPSIPATLLRRLRVVQVRGHDRSASVQAQNTPIVRTITDASDIDALPRKSHVRYLPSPISIERIMTKLRAGGVYLLDPLSYFVESVALDPPRSLHLPAAFLATETTSSFGVHFAVNELVSACARAKVDLVWHDDDLEKPHAVSPSFQRYTKELEAKQQPEQGGQ
jgi:hypothetical protein